jgi:hypothetical protein
MLQEKPSNESISLASYKDGEMVLIATKSIEYGEESGVEIPLNDATEVHKLLKGLMKVYDTLITKGKINAS